MTAKTSPARVAAFLQAVRETGNQTLACERAKVSRSWVQLHRSTDEGFRAAVDEAVESAQARLAAGEALRPTRGWRAQAGEELVVRGGNGRRVQVARARLKQWTPRAEARFLGVMMGCANVHAACAAVGLSVPSAYGHRARWPDFGARWDAAVEEGQLRLEAAMLAEAGRFLAPGKHPAEPSDVPITGMTAGHALELLRLRGTTFDQRSQACGGRRLPTSDEVDRKIEKIIARMERVKRWEKARQS